MAGAPSCSNCPIEALDLETLEWERTETTGLTLAMNASYFQAGEGFVGAYGFRGAESSSRFNSKNTLALLDLETSSWRVAEPSSQLSPRSEASLHWTGSEFLIWGGYVAPNNEVVFQSDTILESLSDGALYDPERNSWRTVPPAWDPGKHTFGTNPPQGRGSSVWTPQGLFVCGSDAPETATRAALFEPETGDWRYFEPSQSPSPRRHFQLSHHKGKVYLLGGYPSEVPLGDISATDEAPRELWRFSLDTGQWERLEVPDYADLQGASGECIGDRLVLLGHRCAAGALFDESKSEWHAISGQPRPPPGLNDIAPSVGELSVVSGKLVLNGLRSAFNTGDHYVWILDLE